MATYTYCLNTGCTRPLTVNTLPFHPAAWARIPIKLQQLFFDAEVGSIDQEAIVLTIVRLMEKYKVDCSAKGRPVVLPSDYQLVQSDTRIGLDLGIKQPRKQRATGHAVVVTYQEILDLAATPEPEKDK